MAIMSSTTTSTLTVKSATAIATGELEQIQEWNSRIELESVERCVHDVIAEKTQTAPSAEAIAAWDGTLTYSQLDALSTALASRLVELGHSREKFIGLLFDKSKWTSVSVLAVMKAGAAFFLIDSSLPDQRIRRMCEIAQASAVITSPSLSTRAGQFERPILVAEHESQRTVTTLVSLPTVSPRDALYVAFTSGSTGDPKCVVNTHTAATSGIQPYSRRMGLTQQSRMFQLSSYSFVIGILDHLGALMNGACLCVPSAEQVQNSLARAITELNANWVELTPSVARGLEPREVQTLRTVVLVGEATTLSDLDTWRGSVDLKTCYGQTENCLGALIDDKTETSSPSDMGYPWAAHCWVVNPNSDDLVPIGAEGELWLEGPSLARGYFNNAEQTAAVFIENPTWMQKIRPGERARFLRTGDLVRYRPESGMLQYVGRGGTQVKLRGQRIELADVESHLKKQFPEADATIAEVVNPSQDANGALLVAFIMVGHATASGDAATDAPLFADTTAEFSAQSQNALAQLQDTLPKYMVPTTVVPLAARPLTASGKLDRKLLRSKACELGLKLQTYHLITETKAHRPARTENEVVIRDMCAGLLRSAIEDINMDASFFELGGNSISAMWLVSRAREAGFAFTSANVFQQMSLAELAGKYGGVGSARDTGAETASELPLTAAQKEELTKFIPPDIDPSNVSDFFPCSHEQQWQLSNQKAGAFLFRFSGPLQVDRLQTACRRLVQTHSSLRSLFTLHDGRFMQVILKDIDDFPFTIRHSNSPTQDPLLFAKDLCATEPAVERPVRPLQFTLIPGSSGQEHVLILHLSHGQYDGICQQTLISDLCALYQNSSDPGVVPTNFAHYARHLARQQTPDESAFWKKLLEGSNITRLPTPLQNPSRKVIPLHCATTIPIPGKPLPTGVTLATVVKAAWSHVLRKATGSQDIVFAQYVALRDLESVPQAHRLVGFCVNSCPVRVDFNGGSGSNNKPIKTALDLLHALKTQHTQTIPFKASQWDYTVSNSTDWPRGSEMQSTYIDVNFDIEKAFDLGGRLRCELVDYLGIFPPLDAMRVTSGPRGDKELKIELTSSTTIVEGDRLEFLLGELSRTVADFMASPERPLDGI